MQDPLQKLTLPDGTIIFTVHRTIQDLTSVLLPPNDTHDTSKQHTNSHQYISNKIISSKSKNRNLLNTHRIAEFSPTKIIKSNIKRLVQKNNNKKHGAEEVNTIHFIPDPTTHKSSNPHNKHPLPSTRVQMTKCVAKELLTNLDYDALDYDQAKKIHAKLHVITPNLPTQVDYTNHDLDSLKTALLAIKSTYEKYDYNMSAFLPSTDVLAPQTYVIDTTFPLDALSTLLQDQAMAMLTNYYNNNNLSGKTKTLHRKDHSALILIIYDIIKSLQKDTP